MSADGAGRVPMPCCLALSDPAQAPTGCLMGPMVAFGGITPVGTSQSCCCGCLCLHSEPQTRALRTPHSLHRRPCSASLSRGYRFSPQFLGYTGPRVCPSGVESLSPPLAWNSCSHTCLPSKSDSLGAPPSIARAPGWDAHAGSGLSRPGESFSDVTVSQSVRCPP